MHYLARESHRDLSDWYR